MRLARHGYGKVPGLMAAWLLALLFAPAVRAQGKPCDIVLSTTQVDYGRLSRALMPADADGHIELPVRSVRMHIQCPEARDMTVVFQGAPADGDRFRFMEHGRFVLRLRDGRLDGAPVDLAEMHLGQAELSRAGATQSWRPGHGVAPVRNGQPIVGREFSATFDIVAQVDDEALTVADAARWSATGSIELSTAAASRELILQAEVQPGRCNVEVARHISFGRLRSTDLDTRGASTRVPSTQHGRLRVLCDGPMPFAFRVMRDERAGTAVAPTGLEVTYPATQLFGLGKTPGGEKIGAYVLHWGASAASNEGELLAARSVDGGRTWAPANGPIVADHDSGARVGYATVPHAATGPLAVKALDVTLDATIFIAPKSSLSLVEEVKADGLMTFEIIY
jgi:hypothetical protein